MNSITLPRATVQQALEALGAMNPYPASKEDQRASALAALRAALAQAEPAQEPVAWLAPRTVDSYSRPDLGYETCSKTDYGAFPAYTAPPQRDALLQALQNLFSVCQRMDLEHQAERPSEAEYQTAMQAAQAAIHAVEGGA